MLGCLCAGLLGFASLQLTEAANAPQDRPNPGESGAQGLVSDLFARLLAALGPESSPLRHQPDRVVPLLDGLLSPHFDKEYAAHLVLGLHWRAATPEQRQRFATVLYQRLLRTYAGSVSEWTRERVRLMPVDSDPAALQVLARSQVKNSSGALVEVDYRLHQTDEGWKIFDVLIDGVSYMRSYRDDTDAELSSKGLDEVIARLATIETAAAGRALGGDRP